MDLSSDPSSNQQQEELKIGSAQWLTSNIGLYGRQDELEILNEAYERTVFKKRNKKNQEDLPVPELVLINGLPGVGKTHLVKHSFLAAEQHAKSNNKQQGGDDVFFISGKFEKLRSRHPYSAIHEAFTKLTRKLLEQDRDFIHFIITDIMRGNQHILTDLFPMLREVIGYEAYFEMGSPHETETTTGTAEVRNRFHFAFRNFLKTVCNYKPIVLLIEDLQWSDSDSLHLLKGFLEDRSIKRFLLIGSYRSNEVGPGHELNIFNNDLKELNIRMSSIEITTLSSDNVQKLILETFPTSSDDDDKISPVPAEKLSDIVYKSTKGNCFHVLRLLLYFLSENLLTYNDDTKSWNYDSAEIQSRDLPSSVEELIVLEIHKQPKSVIQLLKIGAALGTYFDDYTVSLILRSGVDTLMEDDWGKVDVVAPQQDRESTGSDDSASFSPGSFSTGGGSSTLRDTFARTAFESLSVFRPALRAAVAGGFLFENGKLGYKFCHDKVRLAAYELIEDSSRAKYHLEIGRLMVRNASPARQKRRLSSKKVSIAIISEDDISEFVERQLFVAVDQLNRGKEFITETTELENLISLNLRAAEKAYFSASFLSSKAHLDIGSDVLYRLSNEPWQSDDYYNLCLQLHTKQADVELALGNHDAGRQYVQSVLDNARSRSEKVQVQFTLIRSLSRQEKFLESVILSRSVLKELGVYPKRFTTIQALRGYMAVNGLLKKYTDDKVFKLPTIVDKEKLFAMEVLRHLSNNAFMSQRMMDFLLSVVTRIRMSFDDGRCDETSYAFATHAVSLVMFGDQDGAVRCANLASKLLETNKGNHLDGLVLFVVHRFVDSWSYPAADVMRGYRRGYVASMDCGDVECGFVNWYQSIWHAFDSGSKLRPLLQSLVENVEQADLYGCKSIVHPSRFVVKSFKQLCGLEPLDWNEMDEFQPGADFEMQTLAWIYLVWLLEAVFFRQSALAESLAKKLLKVADHDASYNVLNLRLFYTGLFASARAHETGKSKYVKKLQNCEKQLEDLVNKKGRNCVHRHLLLKAECMAVKSKDLAMIRKSFDDAISAAKEAKCLPDVALANELAGEYMLKKQDDSSAGAYMTEAWVFYLLWGAEQKSVEMERKYEALIDKSQRESANTFELLNLEFISSDMSSPDQKNDRRLPTDLS